MLKAVTMTEIELVFSVTDALGLSREAVKIPLRPAQPGYVKRIDGGRLEIGVDALMPTAAWLPTLRELLERELRR